MGSRVSSTRLADLERGLAVGVLTAPVLQLGKLRHQLDRQTAALERSRGA
jgi:hypothetical protein